MRHSSMITNDPLPGHVWSPVPAGRHAFPSPATKTPDDEKVTAFCGIEMRARELRSVTGLDWIQRSTCMDCWQYLAQAHPRS